MGRDTFTSARSQEKIARILNFLLSNGPQSALAVGAACFLSRTSTSRYLRFLLKKPRQIRIAAWRPHPGKKGRWAPLYGFGFARDCPEPPRESRQSRYKRERTALVTNLDAHDKALAKRRAKGLKPSLDTLTAWIPRARDRCSDSD